MNTCNSELPPVGATGKSANPALPRTVGKMLYGLLFVVLLPVGLVAWAVASSQNVSLPAVHAPGLGITVALVGALLVAAGMLSLTVYGRGLPMNAYPPPLYVSRGAYRLVRHPIYVGFSFVCIGAALACGSASGLWLVSPVAIMGCAALVLGYEGIELRQRFGELLPQPLLRIPAAEQGKPDFADRLSSYLLVFIPWLALYQALACLGVPATAPTGFLPFERTWPVLEWTEALYASTYVLVLLAPLVAPTKRVLRDFAVQGIAGTLLMVLFFTALPLTAPPRPFVPQTPLGELLLFERRFDTPGNAFPSYHVFWILLAMGVYAARMPRWRYAWWTLAAAVCLSSITTRMHSLLDVAGGIALFVSIRYMNVIWELFRKSAEEIANSWREWRWGSIRIINHGAYAGIGSALAVALVSCLVGAGQAAVVFLVACSGLVGAGMWAQFVEGCPSLLRPFGYYGGVLGIIFGAVLARWLFGTDPWLLLAAYSVAAPWVQSFGRLRCLVQGCCHGRKASDKVGIIYMHPRSRVCRLTDLKGVPIHPTQLYSILWNFIVAAAVTRVWLAQSPLAMVGGTYLLLSGIGRFVEEAYRGEPQTRSFAGLRLYQWMAVLAVVAGAVVTCLRTEPAPKEFGIGIVPLLAGLVFGAATWFAMGVDFPASNRRFARLA